MNEEEKYPYFVLPTVRRILHDDLSAEERAALLQRAAILSPDRLALANLVGEDASLFASFYPPEPLQQEPDTDATIDSFLNTYGNSSKKEIDTLTRLIFNPTPDYASVLAAEAAASGAPVPEATTENDVLINKFISQSQQQAGHFPVTVVERPTPAVEQDSTPVAAPTESENGTLSESLAKIYVRKHKYSKALEIISAISLNNPEKSIYFADQIRFLRKLVLIENKKQKNNQ
ncbi:MAG: hypothetical protein HUK12_04910 [Muribaculaceae bacterium]|nr:hypothetical protein [Muribaculaceae bacterium]